jgi:flagellar biosynthesis protein FlhG
MAKHFGALGKQVLVIDADLGLANVDIVMGLSPQSNLSDLFEGSASLESLLIPGPPNVTILPASSGVQEMSLLSDDQVLRFMEAVNQLKRQFEVVLVDTGAGIGRNVQHFNAATQDVLVVVTPEPTSITDGYALIKVLNKTRSIKKFRLIVNRVKDRKQALNVYSYLTNVADKFLDVAIDFLGHVVADEAVTSSVVSRKLLLDHAPDSAAADCIRKVVETLDTDLPALAPTGNLQFFWQRLIQQPEAQP